MKKIISLFLALILLAGLLNACGDGVGGETETQAPAEPPAGPAGETDDTPAAEDTIIVDPASDGIATLAEAVLAAKELREAGFADPITIKLTAGVHYAEETILLDVPDLTIEPLNGEATVVGGYRVTGFEPDTFNGAACLSAPVRNDDFTDFIVNGERAKMTRYPEEGYLTFEDTEIPDQRWDYGSKWVVTREGDIPAISDIERVTANFIHLWIDEHTPIESYDPSTRVLTFRYCSQFAIEPGDEYWLENVAETFGHPDEWYVRDGRVYYVPRDDSVTAETIVAYVPTTAKLFDIRGAEDAPVTGITLRDLTLSVSRGEFTTPNGRADYPEFATNEQSLHQADGLVSFRYAGNCAVENCSLTSYGLYGINIDRGSHRIAVRHCRFFDGGAGGVKIIGDTYDHGVNSTTENTVADCTILHCGRRHNSGCGILMIYTGKNTIEHNEIGDLYYSGISVGWGWGFFESPTTYDNLITWNHIHDIGQGRLSDLGGIYTLSSQPGSVYSHNLIHDVSHRNYGSRAFGLDAGTAGIIIENNICYNLGTSVLGNAFGENILVRNNIFVTGGDHLTDDGTDREEHTLSFERNIFVTEGKPLHDINRPTLSKKLVTSANNLIYDRTTDEPVVADFGKGKTWTLEEMQNYFKFETGSILADPLFRDLDGHDFTLAEDSPAYEIGFVPFDLSDVGPRY